MTYYVVDYFLFLQHILPNNCSNISRFLFDVKRKLHPGEWCNNKYSAGYIFNKIFWCKRRDKNIIFERCFSAVETISVWIVWKDGVSFISGLRSDSHLDAPRIFHPCCLPNVKQGMTSEEYSGENPNAGQSIIFLLEILRNPAGNIGS